MFLGIVVIEAIILLPSYWGREADLLASLEREGIQAATVMISARTIPGADPRRILTVSRVAGFTLYDPNGTVREAVGEAIEMVGPAAVRSGASRRRSPDGSRYEVFLRAGPGGLPEGLALRLDGARVGPALAAFALRVVALALVTGVLVTVVTMLLLGRRLIIPMLRLCEELGAAASDPAALRLSPPAANQNDECGDVVRAVDDLLGRIAAAGRETRSLAKLPSENPNPVLRVSHTGVILYANEASHLIDGLIRPGGGLDPELAAVNADTFGRDRRGARELDFGARVYSFDINPVIEEGYNCIYGRDVTAEREAERSLRRAKEELEGRVRERTRDLERRTEELRANEWKFKAVFENCPLIMYLKDTESRLVLINKRYKEFYEITEAEAIGKTPHDWMPAAKAEEIIAHEQELVRTGECHAFEIVQRSAGGEPRTLLSSKSPVVDDAGRVVGIAGFATDITNQKRALETVEAAKKAAEAANDAKSRFLANMSHEIRTPMNGVLGMARLILDTDLSEQQREFVGTIIGSGEGLLGIINDILDYSKLEAGKLLLESRPFDLHDVVDGVVRLMGREVETKGLDCRVDYGSDMPRRLAGDAGRLRQVLINLLGNAVKFTDRGSVTIAVTAPEVGDETAMLRIAIADSGIGISEAEQVGLFERFAQADTSMARRFGGTGLGLSISRQLVELMGGRIWVESEPGSGSTFTFTARFARAACAEDAAAASQPPPAEPTATRPLRILLAEDNAINRRIAIAILERAGHRVSIAADGIEAVNAVRTDDFDVVLMDVQMPNMDGVAATKAIRAFAGDKGRVPIVAVTANAMSGDREHYLSSGFDDYVSKPFVPRSLLEALARQAADRAAPPPRAPDAAETAAAAADPRQAAGGGR